jgi:hypothetical protein
MQALLGASTTWINVGSSAAPQWQRQTVLSQIEQLGFTSLDDLLAECAAAGITPSVSDPPPAAVAAPIDMAAVKSDAKRRVAERADEIAEVITGTVPLAERLSWPTKEAAARAILAGTATAVQQALISAEGQVTGETNVALAARIVANADTYIVAAGLISGQRRKTMAAIDALTDPATVSADLAAIFTTAEAEAQALLASLTG